MVETGRALVTAPAEEPLSRYLAKQHLREDGTSQDDLIDSLIVAAREWVERRSWRALVSQTWDVWYDRFPLGGDAFCVPLPPLASVTSITYVDTDGVEQTLSGSAYDVDTSAEPGLIRAVYNTSWPEVRDDTLQAVKVRFVCGYGTASAVPKRFVQAMLLLVGHWYANRETVVVGTINSRLEQAADALIDLDHVRRRIA